MTKKQRTHTPRPADGAPRPIAAGERGPRWMALACPALVFVLAWVAFWPALGAEFVDWDDYELYVHKTQWRGLSGAHLHWMFTTVSMGHYQPLTWLSLALDHALEGLNPQAFHRTSVLLHALNAVLVYLVAVHLIAAAQRCSPAEPKVPLRVAAAVAALLYAVHPLRVESVAWLAERRDVLSLFFLLLALLAYLRAFAPGAQRTRSYGWYVLSVVFLLCSLLSKAWGMSFFVIIAILDVYPLRRLPERLRDWARADARTVWLQKLPYIALGVGAAVMAGYAQSAGTRLTVLTLDEWPVAARLAQASYGLMFYVWKTVWPTGLVALYERPYQLDPLSPPFVAAYAFVIIAALAVLLLRKRWPGLASAAAIYVVVLAPVLGLAQTGPQLVADKYTYISCIGWSIVVGGGLASLWRRRGWDWRSYVAGAASGAVVLVLLVLTMRQTAVWHDTWSLWRHALAVRPSAAAHTGYAILLREDGRIEEAIAHFDAALAFLPDYGTAWLNRGVAQHKLGELEDAERCYRTALEHIYDKHNAYSNLGQLYLDRLKATRDPAQLQQALEAFGAAVAYVEQHPEAFSPQPYLGLGMAQLIAGRLEAARVSLVTAQRYQETHAAATQQLQVLEQLAHQGRER